MMIPPRLLRPDRVRTIERPFGWISFRLLSLGWLPRLRPTAKLLYFFLCLVADGRGISFYGKTRLCQLLGLSEHQLATARDELCRWDLLAFNGRVYQLLSLPPAGPGQETARRRGHETEQAGGHEPRLLGEE